MKRFLMMFAAATLFASAAAAQTPELKVDEVQTRGEELTGNTVAISGLCSHLCAHGGRRMFLRGAKTVFRVESTKATGAFPSEVVNEPVRVVGVLKETRIDETYLRNWEERLISGSAGHDGCGTEVAARGDQGDTDRQKIDNFRKRIAERNAKEGKNYLSVFYLTAESYEIL